MKFLKDDFLKKGRDKYLKKLANFEKISEPYT